jgi:hypothetical protein
MLLPVCRRNSLMCVCIVHACNTSMLGRQLYTARSQCLHLGSLLKLQEHNSVYAHTAAHQQDQLQPRVHDIIPCGCCTEQCCTAAHKQRSYNSAESYLLELACRALLYRSTLATQLRLHLFSCLCMLHRTVPHRPGPYSSSLGAQLQLSQVISPLLPCITLLNFTQITKRV